MKTVKKVYKVYSFDELSEEAKDRAIEDAQSTMIDLDLDLAGYEWDLKVLGYRDPKIYYSGFWSQGDGASFECTVDLKKWIKSHGLYNEYRLIYANAGNCTMIIKQSGHYYHENTMRIESEAYGMPENVQDLILLLEDVVLEDARDEARKIYKSLEIDYESMTSRESIVEMIEANKYEFYENGSVFNE